VYKYVSVCVMIQLGHSYEVHTFEGHCHLSAVGLIQELAQNGVFG